MNSRKLFRFFIKTFVIGGIVGTIASFFVMASDYALYLNPFNLKEIAGVFIFYMGYALVFTVVSQTGFFAYLFIQQFGASVFKALWPTAQLLVVISAVATFIYVPSKEVISLNSFIVLAIITIVFALIFGYLKVRQTNFTALIPALFLMIVMTMVEWTPVIRGGDLSYIALVLPTLITANGYQLLALHEVTKEDPEHERRKEERQKERERLKKEKKKQAK